MFEGNLTSLWRSIIKEGEKKNVRTQRSGIFLIKENTTDLIESLVMFAAY